MEHQKAFQDWPSQAGQWLTLEPTGFLCKDPVPRTLLEASACPVPTTEPYPDGKVLIRLAQTRLTPALPSLVQHHPALATAFQSPI